MYRKVGHTKTGKIHGFYLFQSVHDQFTANLYKSVYLTHRIILETLYPRIAEIREPVQSPLNMLEEK